MKRKTLVLCVAITAVVSVYLNNASFLAEKTTGKPFLLAHRGLGQTYPMAGVDGKTNTAARIFKPEHTYLENTIASMQAAFDDGADIVELDIRLTKDKQFAVFHDAYLEYRTNASGDVSQYTMAELKKLDIGFGYTADSGKTYPFRGKGIGLMPSLDEVLARFPSKALLIHIKSNDREDGERLAARLRGLPPHQLALLAAYGGDVPVNELKNLLPQLRVASKVTMKKVILQYEAIGWTGIIPASLRHTEIHLPVKYAPYIWGWPLRFMARMNEADTRIILMRGEGEYSSGFDEVKDLKEIPQGFTGGIWTNRIDRIGHVIKN